MQRAHEEASAKFWVRCANNAPNLHYVRV